MFCSLDVKTLTNAVHLVLYLLHGALGALLGAGLRMLFDQTLFRQ